MNLKKTYMINNNTPTEIDIINKSLKSSLLSLFFIRSPSYVAALSCFFIQTIFHEYQPSFFKADCLNFLIYVQLVHLMRY